MAAEATLSVQKVLPFKSVRKMAKQTQGLLSVPDTLKSAIASFLKEYTSAEVKRNVKHLSSTLRKKTAVAASIKEINDEEPSEFTEALDEYMARNSTSEKWTKPFRHESRPRISYEENKTVAYIASRMPAAYSAAHCVLSEVARRLPDIRPSCILDFGSGPGTSIWALRQVWPGSVKHVNVVETSTSMVAACKKLLEDVEDVPVIQNHKSLQVLRQNLKQKEEIHDIVIAAYSLGELSSIKEQMSAARQLWAQTQDLLIVVEPGTERGSRIVRDVRSHILALERKRLWRHLDGEMSSEPSSHESARAGAFIVAPCPHDGQCPMDKTSKFCHFVQRLERTASQHVTKRLSSKPLRGYEDEKFSYVVIRRGTRPRLEWPLDGTELLGPKVGDGDAREIHRFEDEQTDDNEDNDSADVFQLSDSDLSDDSDQDVAENYLGESSDSDEAGQDVADGHIEELSYSDDNEPPQHVDRTGDNLMVSEDNKFNESIANMSGGWGRIVFSPIRRGKLIILDVCSAASRDGSSGALDRRIVSRSRDPILQRHARKSRWGDLWPCE